MADSGRQEMLADAFAACDRLERLGESYGDSEEWAALGVIRRMLRRQGMLLTLGALLLSRRDRDEVKISAWVAECRSEQHALTHAEILAVVEQATEKPVPGPTPNPPVPDDHAEAIRSVEEGNG